MLYLDGMQLGEVDAARVANALEVDPADVALRIQRMGYRRRNGIPCDEDSVWLTVNHPELDLGAIVHVPREVAPELYAAIRSAWDAHLAASPEDPVILRHAARFASFDESTFAESLLRRGALLEPTSPRWFSDLGNQLMRRTAWESEALARRTIALEALESFERARDLESNGSRHAELVNVAKAAYLAGLHERAASTARQVLAECGQYESEWFHGNSVHHANIVLGQVALANGDLEEAARRLEAAGKTPGSPQLNSFGPDLTLARALLAVGRAESVATYLQECSRFWRTRRPLLDDWIAQIRAGEECALDELGDDDDDDGEP